MNDNDFKTDLKPQYFNPPDLASELFGVQAIETSNSRQLDAQNMQALQPTNRPLPQVIPQSLLLNHSHIEALSAKHNLPMPLIGIAPAFQETRFYQGLDSTWVLSRVRDDVLWQNYGGRLPIAKEARYRIDRIVAADINFKDTYIAHEVPSHIIDMLEPGQPVPQEWILPPPPKAVAQRTQNLAKLGTGFWYGVQGAVKGAVVVGLAVTAGAAVVGATAVGGMLAVAAAPALVFTTGLDPILLGVNYDESWTVDGRPIGMWYYICHWYWPE